MAKLVVFLVSLAVFISAGTALKCYNCHSDKADGCRKSANPPVYDCGRAAPGLQSVCAYKVFYDDRDTKHYQVTSGCEQIPEGSPIDKRGLSDCDSNKNHLEIKECRVCNTDLCNSAPVVNTNLFSLLCLPIMYFVTRYVFN